MTRPLHPVATAALILGLAACATEPTPEAPTASGLPTSQLPADPEAAADPAFEATSEIAVAPEFAAFDPTAPLPGDSLFHLATPWTDQRDRRRVLTDFRGDVVVVAMMFTHCEYACPRIVADMLAIQAGVDADDDLEVSFVLASYDTRRDTPEKLRTFAADKGLDAERWTLLHGHPDGVRELSAAMGGSYAENDIGNFAHSNQVAVLDRNGRIVHMQEGLGIAPDGALTAIRKLFR